MSFLTLFQFSLRHPWAELVAPPPPPTHTHTHCKVGAEQRRGAGLAESPLTKVTRKLLLLVVSIGNQKFGIPREYQYQIGIRYFFPQFLGIFLVFCRCLEYGHLETWFNIGIFRQNKNRFGIWFLLLSFHWYRFGFGLSFSWKWHL